eukprot:2042941-Amphidinium_carterae.1
MGEEIGGNSQLTRSSTRRGRRALNWRFLRSLAGTAGSLHHVAHCVPFGVPLQPPSALRSAGSTPQFHEQNLVAGFGEPLLEGVQCVHICLRTYGNWEDVRFTALVPPCALN